MKGKGQMISNLELEMPACSPSSHSFGKNSNCDKATACQCVKSLTIVRLIDYQVDQKYGRISPDAWWSAVRHQLCKFRCKVMQVVLAIICLSFLHLDCGKYLREAKYRLGSTI
ncbi:hypothetical protein FGO68_gene11524 [Halteria grandinella]|uniref:Uncharacterized protein n=1 Tax=Halteria grandinella TaxID=5974 RepID=A0A8J8NBB9_HALGN|nr:hypothetical protein FGO68_gene11524 [Halteria grandinella]